MGWVWGVSQGAIAQVRPRPPRKWRASPGSRKRRARPYPVARSLRARYPVPRIPLLCRCARLLVGGRFSSRHFADAPQRWAWAPPLPSVPRLESVRGWVRAGPRPLYPEQPRAGNDAHGRHPLVGCLFWDPLPRPPPPTCGTKGGGASPRVTFPALRTRPAPISGEEWAAGLGERLQDGPLPRAWKLGVVSPFHGFGSGDGP